MPQTKKPVVKKTTKKKSNNPADSYPANKDSRGNATIGGGEGKIPSGPRGNRIAPTYGGAKNGKVIKKAKTGTSLGMKSVKAGYDKNPGVTRADIITAATKKAKTGTIIPKKNSVSKNVGNLNKAKFGDMLGKAAGSGMFGLAGMAANKLFGDKKKTGGTIKKCRYGCK